MIQEGTLIIWRAGTHSREHSGERLVRLFLSSAFPFGLTQTLKNKSGELLKIGMGDYTLFDVSCISLSTIGPVLAKLILSSGILMFSAEVPILLIKLSSII
jgi:hypothetical protein